MDKKFLKKLREEKEAYDELKNEPPFKGEEFAEEIAPLLDDYFEGEFQFDGKEVVCKFANGQTFLLKAEEVKQ